MNKIWSIEKLLSKDDNTIKAYISFILEKYVSEYDDIDIPKYVREDLKLLFENEKILSLVREITKL